MKKNILLALLFCFVFFGLNYAQAASHKPPHKGIKHQKMHKPPIHNHHRYGHVRNCFDYGFYGYYSGYYPYGYLPPRAYYRPCRSGFGAIFNISI